jgi:hypothetical protein
MGLAMQLYKQPVDGEPGRSARDRSQHLYLTQTLEVRFGSLVDVRHLDSELARKQTWDAPVTSDYVPQADIQRRRPELLDRAVLHKFANDCSQHLWSFPCDVLE